MTLIILPKMILEMLYRSPAEFRKLHCQGMGTARGDGIWARDWPTLRADYFAPDTLLIRRDYLLFDFWLASVFFGLSSTAGFGAEGF